MTDNAFFRNKISFLSFFSSVLVVFIHAHGTTAVPPNTVTSHIEFFVSKNIAQVAVPLLFSISAFLFYQNFDFSKLLEKYKKRFKSLVIPYLLWNTIYLVVFFFLSRLPFVNEPPVLLSAENILGGIFLYKYNMTFWFIFQLILMTILCPIIFFVFQKRLLALLSIGLLLVLCAVDINLLWVIRVDCFVYYLIGVYFAMHHKDFILNSKKYGIIGVALFAVSQIFVYTNIVYIPIFAVAFRILLMFSAFLSYNLLKRVNVPPILICSFPIYSTHELILEVFNKLFSFFIPRNPNLILVDYLVSPLITITIIIFAAYFIKKKIPKVYAVVWGGR